MAKKSAKAASKRTLEKTVILSCECCEQLKRLLSDCEEQGQLIIKVKKRKR